MYTKQVLGSVALAAVAGFFLLSSGAGVAVGGAGALLTYFLARWGWATFHRTRYWLDRGTQGHHSETCPDCNRDRYRMSGDWVLRCHRCGWVSGYPVLRWFYRSVPAVQFRRTVSPLGAFVSGIAITLLAGRSDGLSGPSGGVTLPALPLPSAGDILFSIGVVCAGALLVAWLLRPRQYYCAKCGQDLGRGDPPDTCPRCGSNRFTNEDPGVAQKIELK